MHRREFLAGIAILPTVGCTSVLGPRGRFDESTPVDSIVLSVNDLSTYRLEESSREPYHGEVTHLVRDFVAINPDKTSPDELSSTASVYPSPRRAGNMVDQIARVDYGRSTRYELAGRPVLEWTGAGDVRIAARDSNLFLLIETEGEGDGHVEQATEYLRRMLTEVPPHSTDTMTTE
jgi:hypothetical protein